MGAKRMFIKYIAIIFMLTILTVMPAFSITNTKTLTVYYTKYLDAYGFAKAEWVSNAKHSGDYSVHLFLWEINDFLGLHKGYTTLWIPVNITLGDINLNETYFYELTYYLTGRPYVAFELSNGVRIQTNAFKINYSTEWTRYKLSDILGSYWLWSDGGGGSWNETVEHYGHSAKIVFFIIGFYEERGQDLAEAWFDDITINGVTYPLEPDYVGDSIIVSGRCIPSNSLIQVYWDKVKAWDGKEGLLAQGFAKDALYSFNITIPQAAMGTHYIIVKNVASSEEVSRTFTIIPRIVFEPVKVIPGYNVTVKGKGCPQESQILLLYNPELSSVSGEKIGNGDDYTKTFYLGHAPVLIETYHIILSGVIGKGTGTQTAFSGILTPPITAGTVEIKTKIGGIPFTITDKNGELTARDASGSFTFTAGSINYDSGNWALLFPKNYAPDVDTNITIKYEVAGYTVDGFTGKVCFAKAPKKDFNIIASYKYYSTNIQFSASTDVFGSFSTSIKIPFTQEPGSYKIVVLDNRGKPLSEREIQVVAITAPHISLTSFNKITNEFNITINYEASDEYGITKGLAYIDDVLAKEFSMNMTRAVSSQILLENILEGEHTVRVEIFNLFNKSASDKAKILVDRTPPIIILECPEETANRNLVVKWNVTDSLSGVNPNTIILQVGGTTHPLHGSAGNINVLIENNTVITLKAEDYAGNTASKSVQVRYMVKTTTTAPVSTSSTVTSSTTTFSSSPSSTSSVPETSATSAETQSEAFNIIPLAGIVAVAVFAVTAFLLFKRKR
jgi:hypothetical protein